MQETWVQSLGWEDSLKKGKATHSSILTWRIPRTSPWGLTTHMLSNIYESSKWTACFNPLHSAFWEWDPSQEALKLLQPFKLQQLLKKNWASQMVPVVKNLPASAGDIRDAGSTPGLGRSPGGKPSNHSSILAWRIPWTEEPGVLQSIGLQRVGDDWNDSMHAQAVTRRPSTGSHLIYNHNYHLPIDCGLVWPTSILWGDRAVIPVVTPGWMNHYHAEVSVNWCYIDRNMCD